MRFELDTFSRGDFGILIGLQARLEIGLGARYRLRLFFGARLGFGAKLRLLGRLGTRLRQPFLVGLDLVFCLLAPRFFDFGSRRDARVFRRFRPCFGFLADLLLGARPGFSRLPRLELRLGLD